ncbi:hypothetical protein D5086_002270 [Populus alba]|uniref:Uncharacterized protein n=1 Tax=Populus alba TaxID=43335 RepID=A0ACC4D2N7_POPAL
MERTLASNKALELDSALGPCTVQYREIQGQETKKFLSYFKPCVILIEGEFSSMPGWLDSELYKIILLIFKGEHIVVSVKETFSVVLDIWTLLHIAKSKNSIQKLGDFAKD